MRHYFVFRTYKTNIQSIGNQIDKLKQVFGVSYNFAIPDSLIQNSKDQPKVNKNFGFIAQDFQKIYPELVYEDSDGYLSIDYISVVPLLLETMKEQQIHIEEQQSQLEELTSQVNSIEDNCCNTSTKSAAIVTNTSNELDVEEAKLYQNTPNPFTNRTEIKCYIPRVSVNAKIFIYNMQGNQLKQYEISGRENQTLILSGSELTPGMYFYSLIVDNKEIDTKKMILTK